MHRVSWLVDIGYVVKASEGKFKLDYLGAEKFLASRLGPVLSFLFNGFDPTYGIPLGLQAFYDMMKRHGMEVCLQPMQPGPVGQNRQRRVDVDLGAHLVWQASLETVEAVAITTGDQDLVPAVQLVRRHLGKRVIVFSYADNVHRQLAEAADEWWVFEDFASQLRRP
jgi:uncharacterized LabA/DUF88 family protein